jgi:hypothetical protein
MPKHPQKTNQINNNTSSNVQTSPNKQTTSITTLHQMFKHLQKIRHYQLQIFIISPNMFIPSRQTINNASSKCPNLSKQSRQTNNNISLNYQTSPEKSSKINIITSSNAQTFPNNNPKLITTLHQMFKHLQISTPIKNYLFLMCSKISIKSCKTNNNPSSNAQTSPNNQA